MSGSSFSLTPNLGLFKPTLFNDPSWGQHWNTNADRIDAAWGGASSGGPFLPLTGGTVQGPLNYVATGGTTLRSAQDRAAEAINVKDFGAIGDGISHPLSGVASYGNSSTTGWTLAQWQAVFPFATALTNELDHCAVTAAILAAATARKAVRIPGGTYRAAETFAITLAANGTLTVFGDGAGKTRCECHGAFDWFNVTVSTIRTVSFHNLSVYQAEIILGGQGIAITGPSVNNGRPNVELDHCDIGISSPSPVGVFAAEEHHQSGSLATSRQAAALSTVGTTGAFAVGVNILCCGEAFANNCNFIGAIVAPASPIGVGIRVNGNGAFPSFGPIATGCMFNSLDKGIQVSDGTVPAHVQGVQVAACNIVYCIYGVHWIANGGLNNDGLMISGGTTLQSILANVLTDGVQIHTISGNYFLQGLVGVHILNSNNINCFLEVSGNNFIGFGDINTVAIKIESAGTASQVSYQVSSNKFMAYSASGSAPIVLTSGSRRVTVTGNTFVDSVLCTDAGTNVWYDNVGVSNSNAAALLYQVGIPGNPTQSGVISWNTTGTALTYWNPTAFSGAGCIEYGCNVEVDGTFFSPNGATFGSIYVVGASSLVGGGTFTGSFAGNPIFTGILTLNAPNGAWSSNNWGKQLLITNPGNNNNPAFGITNADNSNIIGFVNPSATGTANASVLIAQMPPLSNTTTPPVFLATINPSGITSYGQSQIGGTSGPTWTTGSGVPSSTQPVGSLYSRVSTWAAGATLYVSKGAGAWTAVASV